MLNPLHWFKGLFWRIFAAVWLCNIVILFAVSVWVIGNLEDRHRLERHQQKTQYIASRLITHLEPVNFELPDKSKARIIMSQTFSIKGVEQRDRKVKPVHLKIFSSEGELLFKQGKVPDSKQHLTFELQSDTGKNYRIVTPKPPVQPVIKRFLNRFLSLRLALILLASMLASGLISWSISKPLRRLGRFNRDFATDVGDTHMPDSILGRSDEIGDLARDIEFMTRSVQHTLASQRQLLHDVSHELRAPLARLQTISALLEQSADPADTLTSNYTARLNQECERINGLIQRILDLARINQDVELYQRLDIRELVQQLVDAAKLSQPQRPWQLSLPNSALHCEVLPDALQSAIDNIIGNAMKYSDETTAITVSLSQHSGRVELLVTDHGPGIDQVMLDKVAQPFVRAKHEHSIDGYGLGLSIAKRAIEKHQGELTLTNNDDGGLAVRLSWPC